MLTGTVSALSFYLPAVTMISSRLAPEIIAGSVGGSVSACKRLGTNGFIVQAISAALARKLITLGGSVDDHNALRSIGLRNASLLDGLCRAVQP